MSVQAGERKSWNPRLKTVLLGPTLGYEVLMVLKAPPLRRVLQLFGSSDLLSSCVKLACGEGGAEFGCAVISSIGDTVGLVSPGSPETKNL